jgi:hypothetical protein
LWIISLIRTRFCGVSIGELALCVKENDITAHGGFGLCGCARACEGCRRQEGVVFKMLWLDPVAEKQRCLPDSIIAYQTISPQICNGYHQFCQVLCQDLGQPTGWMAVANGKNRKIQVGVGGALSMALGAFHGQKSRSDQQT